MKPTRFAYVCERCTHCKLSTTRADYLRLVCPLCYSRQRFMLCSVVVDRGEYEEWERV